MSAPLKATSRRTRTKAELLTENEELITENERVAGLIQSIRYELEWEQKRLHQVQDIMYEAWVELNDGHLETAKQILDKFFYDEDDYDFDDYDDGGDADDLRSETTPEDRGGVPPEA